MVAKQAPLPHVYLDTPQQGSFLGIDEAGRGCLAGPVVAAAVVLPAAFSLPHLNDSKKLSAAQRDRLVLEILTHASAVGIGVMWQEAIDRINILQATFHAMSKAVATLLRRHPHMPPVLFIDGNKTLPTSVFSLYYPKPCQQKAVVGGDGLIPSISAASIVAKTHRDKIMDVLHRRWPEYHFSKHKGYGTKEHMQAIATHGPCPLHRMTFAPLRTKQNKSSISQGGLLT